ncbi:MAG: hypothetical protein LBR26_02395 [Prevotella sp.]|jgi:hypothetical protein|nr:hypothetical protein [Prevotella sp.]
MLETDASGEGRFDSVELTFDYVNFGSADFSYVDFQFNSNCRRYAGHVKVPGDDTFTSATISNTPDQKVRKVVFYPCCRYLYNG